MVGGGRMLPSQDLFEQLLKLVGQQIEVSARGRESIIQGKVVNAMFDSFIVETDGKNEIIRFEDISYLDPLED